MLTDSHAHLDSEEFAADVAGVFSRARDAGVDRVLTVPSRRGSSRRTVEIAEAHAVYACWAAVGVHPHEAAGFTDEDEAELRELAASERVVAIGEIGLDYHYDHSPRPAQQDAFRRQLRLAAEVGLPVVVHTREAEEDTARILEEEGTRSGVLHCFTSSAWLAERALELGFCVSLSGIVTFKNAGALREIARTLPEDRLMVETDSPYLAPEPGRGWPNEPARVRIVAEHVARVRGVTLERLAATTSATFERLFLSLPAG